MKYKCNCCNGVYDDNVEAMKCDCTVRYVCTWCGKIHDELTNALCCCKTTSVVTTASHVEDLKQKWIDSEDMVEFARADYARKKTAGFHSQGCMLDAESELNSIIRAKDAARAAFFKTRNH